MRRLIVAGSATLMLLASSWVAGSPAAAVAPGYLDGSTPPEERMAIELVAMAGSGCKPGSTDVAVSPDNTAFTVIYSEYLAQAGPGIPLIEGRKNCQINVLVNVPAGFTFAISKVDYRGYAFLQPGASAMQRANYYFQGMTQGVFETHRLAAPMDDNWIISDEVPVASLVWHPCGDQRNLNINTELRVSAGTSTDASFVAMDSTDGTIETTYHFEWMRCPV